MSRGEFFLYALATVCITLVLVAPVACSIRSNELLAEAIRNGADPISANCALGISSQDRVCLIRSAQPPQAASGAR